VELRRIRSRLPHTLEAPRARPADAGLVLATLLVAVAASIHR
jgi:hypothetical protein